MARKILNGLDLGNQRIISLADPSTATDAATKQYVDNVVNGLAWKSPVRAATTANITLSGAQTIDGVAVIAGDRVLVKDQSTGSQNGVYVAAAGAWTRATDMDTSAESVANSTVLVQEGTVNGDKSYTLATNAPITLGTTSLTFTQVGGGSGTTYVAGNGLTESPAGTFNVGAGTGVTIAADTVGVDTSVVVRKYAAAIGNGSLTSIAVTHNLGTRDITWSIYDATSFAFVDTDAVATDTNTLTLTFAVAPTSGQYRVVVHG